MFLKYIIYFILCYSSKITNLFPNFYKFANATFHVMFSFSHTFSLDNLDLVFSNEVGKEAKQNNFTVAGGPKLISHLGLG